MADFLIWLFSAAALWLWVAAAALATAWVYATRHSSFVLTDIGYTFPIFGKLARYSHDYSESSYEGWLNVENALCRDYAKHMSAMSQPQFDNHVTYLRKTFDHGRRAPPLWVVAMLAVLVVLEGLGFSYLLGSLMAVEGSENVRELLMVAVVLVLAAILLWTTHAAGHQFFRTSLLRNCFREFQTSKAPAFSSRLVTLNEPQTIDDKDPEHVQCANRVISKPGDRGDYWWAWIAGILIVVIATGSTVLRTETLRATEAEDARGTPAAMFGGAAPAAAPAAPDDAVAARDNAAMTGFGMLAVIFIITQAVGVSVGYRYGFAGKQSKQARHATRGFADYQAYWEPIQQRMNIANTRLHALHRMLEKHSPRPLEFRHSFIDFIREERERGARDLQLPPDDPGPQKQLPAPAGTVEEVDAGLAQIDEAATREAQFECYERFSPEMRDRIDQRLAERKAAAQEQAQRSGADQDALRRRFQEAMA